MASIRRIGDHKAPRARRAIPPKPPRHHLRELRSRPRRVLVGVASVTPWNESFHQASSPLPRSLPSPALTLPSGETDDTNEGWLPVSWHRASARVHTAPIVRHRPRCPARDTDTVYYASTVNGTWWGDNRGSGRKRENKSEQEKSSSG